MKTLIEKWTPPNQSSFISKQYKVKTGFARSAEIAMRTHEEYEISVLMGCSGKRIVGNTIENFSENDLFLIGPNVPHAVQPDNYKLGKVITLHFLRNSFGGDFFDLPENGKIADLLKEAQRGVAFAETDIPFFYRKMQKIDRLRGFERVMAFFRLLHTMALNEQRRVLSSRGFAPVANQQTYQVVNKIYEYIINRFADQHISLDEISAQANMSSAGFCRFFKKHFSKTFTSFLNEVRVGHACKLIQQTDHTIAEIAFASGYNQLTHFNRQFKRVVGYSPRAYRNELHQQS
ncbi:AraC family transcriptional regulator [Tunicatimonas pelagia]|uniref:AraC family transcriptional regulator n=1 Tax=Tunicatimonas pelagia TaxID=931531 RepID=UPI002665EE0B|nr:AraC family transcriptional regulator [Tunicatimonas pelagia]WKN44868.1 AraC family transcriptional regulator [Tunicatimonas pelagia]